jgi:asparagine synthase (glutamine-hydrolysing)
MFAFALWDANEELLFMARDPFGEKPLFYAARNDSLSFASELPILIKDVEAPVELDPEALLQYLYYQVTLSPKTMLKGIGKLPPGHFATFRNGILRFEDYVGSAIGPIIKDHRSIGECSNEVKVVLDRIVEPLMIADVPIGLCLSGGLDSSLLLAFMSRKASQPIHTFSIGFEQEGFNELPWARKMSRFFGTSHHEDIVDYDILDILPKLIGHLGEPMADASIVPYYHLSRLAASEVKVVLGGDGADEMWGGYRRHLLRPYLPILSAVAPVMKGVLSLFHANDRYYAHSRIESLRLAQELSLAQRQGYMPWNPLFNLKEIRSLVDTDLADNGNYLPVDFTGQYKRSKFLEDPVNRMLWIDQMTFLPEDILTKVDRMSMAHSLEVRSPFLHPDMASLAGGMPGRYKVFGGKGKRLLKMAARNDLPPEIVTRRKHGFNVPIDVWFRGEGRGLLMDTLPSGSLVRSGVLNGRYIGRMIGEHSERRANQGRKLWGLLVLEMWHHGMNR